MANYRYAGIIKRILATTIDTIITLGPLITLILIAYRFFLSHPELVSHQIQNIINKQRIDHIQTMLNTGAVLIYLTISVSYSTYFIGRYGSTIGQKILKLKVIDLEGKSISYKKSFYRALACLLYNIPAFNIPISLLSILYISTEKTKQTIHDKICKTLVLDVKRVDAYTKEITQPVWCN